MKKGNYVISLILVIIAAVFFFLANDFPANIIENVPGPNFFPQVIAIGIIILVVIMVYENYHSTDNTPVLDFGSPELHRSIRTLIVTIAYSTLLNIIGFLIMTPVCLFCLMMIMDKSKKTKKMAAAIITTLIIYVSFEVVLSVPLPQMIQL